MRKRYALDANVLASILNSDDLEHFSCYNHRKQSVTATYIRVTYQEVEVAIQAQADRFCGTVQGPVVLPALSRNEPVSLTTRQEG